MFLSCMWALRIKVKENGNIYGSRTEKHNVVLNFYSQNYYEKAGKLFFVASGVISGKENNKKKFFEELEKDGRIVHLEWNGNFFMATCCEKRESVRAKVVKGAYNPRLIFLRPVIIDSEGYEDWEVASTERKDLEDFIYWSEKLKNVEYKVFYIKEKKVDNLLIYSMVPSLSEKQKEAVELTIREGYFGYPRKVKLEKLAKMMGVSLSTYQFHLAKAEAKLMPFVAGKVSE